MGTKGHWQRRPQISDEEHRRRWEQTFGYPRPTVYKVCDGCGGLEHQGPCKSDVPA